ncbi:L domain-like protein [Rhizopogon salebrosus TDB-379]|nr:L domain-like protein [Rhizopogon salebrosus TDB-379]
MASKGHLCSRTCIDYSARIPFVARPNERNVLDQRQLEYELVDKHGINIIVKSLPIDRVRVRIYRADGSCHVAPISINSTVAELTPSLNQKLLPHQKRETHKLYLKQKGQGKFTASVYWRLRSGRLLRRLQQAAYDQADSLPFLGAEDMMFLMKFVYKSQLLGPTAEELTFDEFEIIDLTGCSLPTIPIVLHQNASSISCVTLCVLRLSSMAMKKVPQSVRYSTSLHRFDLSCNRIMDLDDAGLDRIPELSKLRLKNNRIEQLPDALPCGAQYVLQQITELPKEIGRLTALEHLIFVGKQVTKLPEECRNLVNLRLLDYRRNSISDNSVAYALPKLEKLYADHNFVHAIHLCIGPCLSVLDVSHNDITFLTFTPTASPQVSHSLPVLDVSYAKLSSLDTFDFSQLSSLRALHLDHNELRTLPDSLGELSHLRYLSCYDNKLVSYTESSSTLRYQSDRKRDLNRCSPGPSPINICNHIDSCTSPSHGRVRAKIITTERRTEGDGKTSFLGAFLYSQSGQKLELKKEKKTLVRLPATVGLLQRLETLDAHNNSLTELPVSLWNCASLMHINVPSNLLATWHDPPGDNLIAPAPSGITLEISAISSSPSPPPHMSRKSSSATLVQNAPGRPLPSLTYSLERLSI